MNKFIIRHGVIVVLGTQASQGVAYTVDALRRDHCTFEVIEAPLARDLGECRPWMPEPDLDHEALSTAVNSLVSSASSS